MAARSRFVSRMVCSIYCFDLKPLVPVLKYLPVFGQNAELCFCHRWLTQVVVLFNLKLQHSAKHSFLHTEHCVLCQISNRCTDGCVYTYVFDRRYHAATGQTIFHTWHIWRIKMKIGKSVMHQSYHPMQCCTLKSMSMTIPLQY